MTCHGQPVAQEGDLSQSDIYHVNAVTEAADGTMVRLALNCEDLRMAYETSCARAQGSFKEFVEQVQAEADAGAADIYNQATALNEAFLDNPRGLRILRIRICIKIWKWIKIYVWWRI